MYTTAKLNISSDLLLYSQSSTLAMADLNIDILVSHIDNHIKNIALDKPIFSIYSTNINITLIEIIDKNEAGI